MPCTGVHWSQNAVMLTEVSFFRMAFGSPRVSTHEGCCRVSSGTLYDVEPGAHLEGLLRVAALEFDPVAVADGFDSDHRHAGDVDLQAQLPERAHIVRYRFAVLVRLAVDLDTDTPAN